MFLKHVIYLVAVFSVAHAQRGACSRERMRQCEDNLMRSIQRRFNDLGRTEMLSQCQNVRDDFNCLLRETRCLTSETDRNRNGDSIRNALKYIRDGCDSSGNSWRDSACFIGVDMKNCESSFPLGGIQFSTYNPETCRKYNLFHDCVNDIVRTRCRVDDDRYLGQYLVDTAQDLAWNCGESSTTSDRYRQDDRRDDRYGNDRYNNDRDRLGDRDRVGDRERDPYRGGSYSGRDDRYGAGGAYGDRDRDRNANGRYSGSYSSGNGSSDVTCCKNERCDRNRLQQCRDSLARAVDIRAAGYQDAQKCRRLRDDFNCMLWHTSTCVGREERDRDNEIFRKSRDFIARNCDNYGRWTENSCYKSSDMQHCETQLTSTRGGANYDSCRSYLSFKECMERELDRRCTREDELFQGAYLADKAQEMSWQCGNDNTRNSNSYSTFDRRNEYDRYDNNNGYDRAPYDSSPIHLEDEDAMCLARAQTSTEQCKRNFDDRRRQMASETDYDGRNRINCCSVREYRNCLFDGTRRYCQTERSRVVDSLLAGYRHTLTADSCLRVYDSECNSCSHSSISFVLLATCIAVLSAIFSLHR